MTPDRPRMQLAPSPHILSAPFVVDDREFVRCTCSLTVETYRIRPVLSPCPIADAWTEYRETVAVAERRREDAIRQWLQIGAWNRHDVVTATAS